MTRTLALSEAATPAPVRSVCLGQGQAQAAALEPGMVSPWTLEEASPPTKDGGAGCASAGGPCFCGTAYSPRQGPGVAGSGRHEKAAAARCQGQTPAACGVIERSLRCNIRCCRS